MSIYSRLKEVHRFQIEAKVGKSASSSDVLDLLFGEYGDECTDYKVYHYRDPYLKGSSVFQRFNTLWVVPLFYICAPFQWLFQGEVGVNQNSKFGKFLYKITGL